MEHIILFDHVDFRGAHRHVYQGEPNLEARDGGRFNDRLSSAFVLDGNWAFYRDRDFGHEYGRVLPPGRYPRLNTPELGIPNDAVTAVKAVRGATIPAPPGGGPTGHAILFEHQNFRGRHRHVVAREPDLAADEDDGFNDRVSAVAVLEGVWRFYRHVGLREAYPTLLGPGLYSWIRASGAAIRNDDVSALEPVSERGTGQGLPLGGHVVLYEKPDFEGYHRHVFWAERDLGHPEDGRLAGRVGSIAVLAGEWSVCRGAEFADPHDRTLRVGLYPRLSEVGLGSGSIHSLEPVP